MFAVTILKNSRSFAIDMLCHGLNRVIVVAILSIVLTLISSRAFAQISTLSSWTNEYHGTSNTQNLTYVVPAGSNSHRILVVAIATSQTGTGARAVTLTYGGQALISAGGDMSSTATRAHTQLYYLNEAGLDAAGSTTLAFTVSGGTTLVNDVFVAVFDGVDQSLPITDTQNYTSGDSNTTNPVFGTDLDINANGQAIEIISSVRVGSTTLRNITYATNWTMQDEETFTTGPPNYAVRNAVANRSVPVSATTDDSSTGISGGGSRGSMTALSLNAYIAPVNSWYSYQSGNFNDFNTWTLDPSGTTFDNFASLTPANGDEITILNGFTVTYNVSNRTLSGTAIQGGGILDMAATTGHDLGVITGTGLLRVGGVALPSGTYTDFVSTFGGTIEYYNIGGNLPTAQTTYNNLLMTNSTGSNITYVLVSDMTVNGSFTLSTTGAGTVNWQINDLSNTQRTITLNGDLTVAAGGRISVGGSNANNTSGNEASTSPHNLIMFGNIVNNGIIRLFYEDTELLLTDYGLSYPTAGVDLHRNELQGNAVTVTFSGTGNKTVTCNNTTDFYRFVVDKGTGQQAILTVNSSNTANFRLFGPADLAANTSPGNSYDYYSDNALSLRNGTLELTGNINIPLLTIHNTTTNGYFALPRNATLWLNGAGVTVTLSDLDPTAVGPNDGKDGRILIGGLLRVTAGTLNGGFSKGLGSQDGGAYLQEGGTVNIWQFRSRATGTGVFSFNQTGGTLNIGYGFALSGGTIDQYEEDYFRFDLRNANCTFQMSGSAVLNVAKPTFGNGAGGDGGLFYVGSSTANYNVTGGTVNLYTGFKTASNSYPGYINSTAPLYNVNLYEESATTETHQLQDNSLVVLNNLTINTGNGPSFITNNLDVTVAGNFIINSGTTYTPGTATTTFNGSGAQSWTHDGTISALASVIMNKPAGTLTLAGSQTFPTITTALTLTSGTLADGGKTVTVTGTLSNSATHSGTGVIVYNNAGASTIGGNNGTFGNLTVQTNATIATSGGQTVTGTLRLVGASTTLNIGSNALNALGAIYSNASPGTAVAFTATKRILTSGLHNAAGLTRQGAGGTILFPVGTGTLYTPASITVTATTHGTITVRPVASQHPNVTTVTQSVRYYWRVTSSGYAGITAVNHSNYNYSTAVEDNPTANYRAARYDADLFTWATSNTVFNATSSPPIPSFSTGTAWAGVIGDRLDGEYTCGNVSAFGNVTVYFSKASGNWNATTTWSNDPVLRHAGADAAVAPPCATCPVVIGDGGAFNHTVTTVANSFCGSLALNTGSTLDCGTFTGHNFGTNTGGSVSGRGRIRINSNVFPPGDFTNFIGVNGGTVEWYGASKTIPTIGGTPQFLNLPNYYNLVLNPSAGQTITLPATNLTTYNDLTIGDAAGYTGTVVTNGARTIAVTGNLTVTRGVFNFANTAMSATTMSVTGNLSVANGASFSVAAGAPANTNTLTIVGNITNNGTMNFNNTGSVDLTFTGANDVLFTGTGSGGTTLSRITVNKGSSNTPTVTFNVGGTVNTTAVAQGWLTLTNGTFDWATANNTTLSTSTYTINSTSKLRVSAGAVTHSSGTGDANDLFLNGNLEVAGGTMNVGNTTVDGNNIDIEYGSAGIPAIAVSSGALWVKSSIRRSTATITGALAYTQSDGVVTVGGISATENNSRGVFEIDANPGSSFTMTGTSSLIVERQTGGSGYADLFINPLSNNVSPTSTITVGLTSNNAQNNFRILVAPTIGNFTIRNGDGNDAQEVNMFSYDLVLGGTLTIASPSILNTNSLDVTIAGDLVCPGTYLGGTNNTTFNGSGTQAGELSATSSFNDFTINKTAGSTLTLSGTSPTLQNLHILSGILDVGPLALDVRRNITNNSSQTGSGSILVYSTTPISNTITSSDGAFTNLTLGGTATTKTITVDGNTTINGVLSFPAADTRYFFIGSSQLTFGSSAGAVVNAGPSTFIKTNGVTSDLGVVRNWPAGTSSFTYAIGTSSNYTPVTYALNVTTPGTLRVIPINNAHSTYNQLSSQQILNYYWTVSRVGSTLVATASGNHTYSYPASLISGSGGTLVAGYLDGNSNPLGWVTSGHGGTANTTTMTFTNAFATNLPADENFYDYSVGTTITLPNPIQPLYSRFTGNAATVGDLNVGGDWTDANNWTTSSDGNGPASAFAPTGVPVVILPGARINTGIGNGRRAFKTTINGLLDNGTRTGHNLGIIEGTGTFRSATNTFPAGNYTAFVSSSGGTIEYVAPMTMNNRTSYNNLSIYSGSSGTVSMTASNLTINGNVTIPSGTTLSKPNDGINLTMSVAGNLQISGAFTAGSGIVNANVSIAGNWINSGTFSANTGTVTFNGTQAQSISGTNPFYGLIINKASNNVTLSGTGTTSVSNSLTLTSGHIISSATNTLALGNATSNAGSGSSFVSGPLTKTIGAAGTFIAPLGSVSANRYRPATIANTSGSDSWSFEYIGNNPTSGGFSNTTMNTTNIGTVSMFEYWLISRSGATSANATLSYNTGSYIPPDIGTVANLRVARWDGSQWDLPPTSGGIFSQSGSNTVGMVTVTNVTSFSPLTLASTDVLSPLPIELISFTGRVLPHGTELTWKTASEINNQYFVLERSTNNAETFEEIARLDGQGTTNQQTTYSVIDQRPVIGKNYYRLKQVDFNGDFSYADNLVILYYEISEFPYLDFTLYPNPTSYSEINLKFFSNYPEQEAIITIYDMQGKKVFEDVSTLFEDLSIKLAESIGQGIYLVEIRQGRLKSAQRLMIK